MTIVRYEDRHRDEVIDLVLHVQNAEYGVGISIDEQPDILDITTHYIEPGGETSGSRSMMKDEWLGASDSRGRPMP